MNPPVSRPVGFSLAFDLLHGWSVLIVWIVFRHPLRASAQVR